MKPRFKSSSKIFLLTVPRWYFFCGSFVLFMSCVVMLSHLFIAALWTPEEKGLTSLRLFVKFIVILLPSHLLSWDRCGTLLYQFLILAALLSMLVNDAGYYFFLYSLFCDGKYCN